MTERAHQSRLVLGMFAALAALCGCDRGAGTDYCRNHYAFHQDHIETIGVLEIDVAKQGDMAANLAMPAAVFGDLDAAVVRSRLGAADGILGLQVTEGACVLSVDDVSESAAGLDVVLTSDCGVGNKLEQVDVLLFEHWPQLEEVVVSVTTPATAKHFAVNRKCERPVFRLR